MKIPQIMLLGFVLAGCAAAAGAPALVPPLVGIEGASVIVTDKTLSDHIISVQTGKNCSSIRRSQGRTYCEEDELGNTTEVFCYPTLGKVTCYAEPQPYGNRQQAVGHTIPGAPQPR